MVSTTPIAMSPSCTVTTGAASLASARSSSVMVWMRSGTARTVARLSTAPMPSATLPRMSELKRRMNEVFGKVGFSKALAAAEILDVGEGRARVSLPVTEAVQNYVGNLHGGAIATIVDDVGTLAIITADKHGRPGV